MDFNLPGRTPKRGVYLILLVLYLAACRSDQKTNIPDVSDIHVDIDIIRFDRQLLADTNINSAGIEKLKQEFPAFSDIYFNHVYPGAAEPVINDDPELKDQAIIQWIKHPRTRWLYDTVQQLIPDLSKMEKGLSNAFTYAKYYFPEKETPKIYATISDFGYFPFIYAEDSLRDGIGISLEMFLGENFPYRKYNGIVDAFSDYLVRSYNTDHLVKRTVEVWVDDLIGEPGGNRLIDYMVHNGTKLYILQSLMPNTPDTVIMDYSSAKMKWAKDNERNIWQLFTSEHMLYETSLKKIQKYIGPSPSSPGMPHESPGNTGSYIGWQIVKAYMKKHPQTTLKELIGMDDAQKFLDESGYRPPR